jgi:hypothetical protein
VHLAQRKILRKWRNIFSNRSKLHEIKRAVKAIYSVIPAIPGSASPSPHPCELLTPFIEQTPFHLKKERTIDVFPYKKWPFSRNYS